MEASSLSVPAVAHPPIAVPDPFAVLLDAEKKMLGLIAEGASLERVLDVLCLTVEKQLSSNALTSVLLLDGNRLRHGAAPSLPAEYNKAIDGIVIGPAVGSCGTAAYERRLVVVSDIQTDPYWQSFVGLAETYGLRACWSAPVLGARGDVLGTFAIYHRGPRVPTTEDLKLIDRVSVIARVAIDWHSAERERGRLLEVAREAQAEAEAERATLREFVMQAPAGLCILRGKEHVFELANAEYLKIIGGREVIGKPIREALPELANQGFYDLLDRVYRTGEPFIGREVPAELDDGRGGRRLAYFTFVYQPTYGKDGAPKGIAVYATEVTDLVEARKKISALEQRLASGR